MVALCLQKIPSLRCSFRKKHLSHAEKHRSGQCRGLQGVREYCNGQCVFFSILPCRLLQCVEIEVLATGCQPFSCPCSRNVTNCWKEICSTCLSKESICIMAASCPSFRCSCRKNMSHAEKQRVWSRSCGLEDLLRNIPISDGSMWPPPKNE